MNGKEKYQKDRRDLFQVDAFRAVFKGLMQDRKMHPAVAFAKAIAATSDIAMRRQGVTEETVDQYFEVKRQLQAMRRTRKDAQAEAAVIKEVTGRRIWIPAGDVVMDD